MKSSVYNATRLVMWYLIFGILGTLAAAVIYMVYALCLNLVAGQSVPGFSLNYFLRGLLVCTPLVFELMVMTLTFYLIRHPAKGWLPMAVFSLLGIVSWFVISPAMTSLIIDRNEEVSVEEKRNLSEGYFRTFDGEVVYFSRVSEDGTADGICIDLKGKEGSVYTFAGEQLPDTSFDIRSVGFRDNLIQTSMEPPKILQIVYSGLCIYLNLHVQALKKGWLAWINFAMTGVALIATCGLRRCSRWRMNNIIFVVTASVFILFMTAEAYMPDPFFAKAVNTVNGALSGLKFLDNPFCLIFDLVISILMIVTGIVCGNIDRGDEY